MIYCCEISNYWKPMIKIQIQKSVKSVSVDFYLLIHKILEFDFNNNFEAETQTMVKYLEQEQSKIAKTNRGARQWTKEEIQLLCQAVEVCGTNWIQVAQMVPNRNANQCAQKWKRAAGQRSQQKVFWSYEEDKQLIDLVVLYGKSWAKIAKYMKKRTSKQCRGRYENKLNPKLSLNVYTPEEDQFIYEKYILYGSKWSQIAKEMPGRSCNQIKNRFYSYIRLNFLKIKNPYYTKQTKQEVEEELETIRIQHLNQLLIKSYSILQAELECNGENDKLNNFVEDSQLIYSQNDFLEVHDDF